MRIQELADKAGLHRDTLLYWERMGLLRPQKERNGYRNYREEDYQRVILIGLGKEAGFTLREISALLDAAMGDAFTMNDLSAILETQLERVDRKIGELSETRARIRRILDDCPKKNRLKDVAADRPDGERKRKRHPRPAAL